MIRQDLAKSIAKKAKLSVDQAEKLIHAFIETATDVLARGDKIVYSNFGTFRTVHYPSKVIFHPKLGAKKKMIMLPTNVVKWNPSSNVRNLVAKGKGPLSKGQDTGLFAGQSDDILTDDSQHQTLDARIKNNQDDFTFEPDSRSESQNIEVKSKIKVAKENDPKDKKNIFEYLYNQAQEITGSKKASPVDENEKSPKITLLDSGFINKDSALSLDKKDIMSPQKVDSESAKHDIEKETDKDKNINNLLEPENSENGLNELDEGKILSETEEKPLSPFVSKNNIGFVDLTKIQIGKELLQLIPEKIAREYKIVPVEENDKTLTIAMVDPENIETIEIIKKITQKDIEPKLSSEADIEHVLDQYQALESEVESVIKNDENESGSEDKQPEARALIASASDDAPAARIVTSLLRRAIRDKASDIHIEPAEKAVEVRFRIDGFLHKKVTLPKDIQSAVISRIKILSNLKIDEQRLPQDGRFSTTVDERKIDFRVSTMPIANGEKVVMRVLDKLTGVLTIEQLGLVGRDLETLKNNISKPHGMILVTGPTGSGKTTTLYALISKIYTEGINIITLEDPIEYQMTGINQSQVNSAINFTFASGLRSILRQDPDVIMIGEVRDTETAEMAVHAALTGHVVISTLHTNDSAGAAPRLIDMGVEPFLLVSSLNLVIGQRLTRKICDECKEEIKIPAEEMEKITSEIERMPAIEKAELKKKQIKLFKGKGCKSCNETGYKGRLGLYELLPISPKIKGMIVKNVPSSEIKEMAVSEGMKTMLQDGLIKAIAGATTIEEVWRVTKD